MPDTHAVLKTVVELKHVRKMAISFIKKSKSRSPRRAGGILAQSLSLVNRASSLCSSQCHDLKPSSFWRRFGSREEATSIANVIGLGSDKKNNVDYFD